MNTNTNVLEPASREEARVIELLDIAVDALRAEDEALRARLEGADDPGWYKNNNRGVLYWLFETTLVYSVFKAWAPRVHVAWEEGYPGSSEKADLVINPKAWQEAKPEIKGGLAGTHIFEAKWWNDESKKTMAAITGDLDKLRGWGGPCCRYLMTFWRSDADKLAADLEDARKALPDHACVIHRRWFSTHRWDRDKDRNDALFVVCTARVKPRT